MRYYYNTLLYSFWVPLDFPVEHIIYGEIKWFDLSFCPIHFWHFKILKAQVADNLQFIPTDLPFLNSFVLLCVPSVVNTIIRFHNKQKGQLLPAFCAKQMHFMTAG